MLRNILKKKRMLGPFKMNGVLITALDEISNKLSEQYSSTFSTPDTNFSINIPREFFNVNENSINPRLIDISFSKEDIVK